MDNKHYLYRHIRIDKDIPFYVGIGSQYRSNSSAYGRSKDILTRNNIWKKITYKTEYEIGIDYKYISRCIINKTLFPQKYPYIFSMEKREDIIDYYKSFKDNNSKKLKNKM